MNPDFEGLLATLVAHQVDFVVIGGYSAMLHGSSLMTRDVDVVCPMNPDCLISLYEALTPLHPVHRMDPTARPFTRKQALQPGWRNLYLRTDAGILDCLGEVRGVGDFDACLARSESFDLGGFSVQVIGLNALIEAKQAMGRPRDLLTASELQIIRHRQSSGPNDTGSQSEDC